MTVVFAVVVFLSFMLLAVVFNTPSPFEKSAERLYVEATRISKEQEDYLLNTPPEQWALDAVRQMEEYPMLYPVEEIKTTHPKENEMVYVDMDWVAKRAQSMLGEGLA